jgi:hypothetical protein
VLAEAACEPKPSVWLDVDRASEGHFPQQGRPPLIGACGVVEPDEVAPRLVARASASTSIDATASNASPARRAESWKSSIIARCCSSVGCVG